MACEYPLMAFDTGVKSDTGKRVFKYCRPGTTKFYLDSLREKLEVMPSAIRVEDGHPVLLDPIPIPCGRCQACLLDKAKELTTLACLESKYWKYAYFLTLSYAESTLPISKFTGEAILCRPDLERFVKDLQGYCDFHWLSCGEYGDVTGRPHYHLIIWTNKQFPLDYYAVNRCTSSVISRYWPYGIHEVSIADTGCIAYVAGYVLKKAKMLAQEASHMPFRYSTRQPGLGFRYLMDHDVLSDRLVYGDFGKDCKSRPVPSAFIRKLEDQSIKRPELVSRIEDYKAWHKSNGERFNAIIHCAYDTVDVDELGGKRRLALAQRFEESRKEKI